MTMMPDKPMPVAPAQPPAAPRMVAISGIIFSLLFIACLVIIRLAVPADPTDPGEWLADAGFRNSVGVALTVIPFTGIAFLWFIAVLRDRVGLLEDRFFATVFLGSGLLFVAMLFATAAVAGALLESLGVEGRLPAQSETYAFGRRIAYALMTTYAIKMAAVFMFVTSSIGIRTAFLPRWLAFIGFAIGVVLLLVITGFAWIALLFPSWVLLVSIYILIVELGQGRQLLRGDTAKTPHQKLAHGD
jgi:hypothetical protein